MHLRSGLAEGTTALVENVINQVQMRSNELVPYRRMDVLRIDDLIAPRRRLFASCKLINRASSHAISVISQTFVDIFQLRDKYGQIPYKLSFSENTVLHGTKRHSERRNEGQSLKLLYVFMYYTCYLFVFWLEKVKVLKEIVKS